MVMEQSQFNPTVIIFMYCTKNGTHIEKITERRTMQIKELESRIINSIVENADSDIFETWAVIQREIDAFKAISTSRERRKKAIDVSFKFLNNLDSLMSFFDKYPSIKAESEYYRLEFQNLSQYINEHVETLERCSREYFKDYFQQQNINVLDISFSPKIAGAQRGRIAVVKIMNNSLEERNITYFIKTHQHGSASGKEIVHPVDPKEIFVYKVLEYIGLGPIAHFFYDPLSQGNFYIATQDCGFSNDKEKQNEKTFLIFNKWKELFVSRERSVDDDIIRQITKADIISRILCLRDVTCNPSNFGFVYCDGRKKCKIIDFRIETQDVYRYRDIFGGYVEGNGFMNYWDDDTLKSIFKGRSEVDRVRTAEQVINELKNGIEGQHMAFIRAVETAYDETATYFERHQNYIEINIARDDETQDFRKYFQSIKINMEEFMQGLQLKITSNENTGTIVEAPKMMDESSITNSHV